MKKMQPPGPTERDSFVEEGPEESSSEPRTVVSMLYAMSARILCTRRKYNVAKYHGARAPADNSDLLLKFPWRPNTSTSAEEGKPGEYILRGLFLEYCRHSEKKIEQVLAEPLERPLSNSLRRGEDAQFDQILSTLGCVAEHSLPSILRTLFLWYEHQTRDEGTPQDSRQRHRSKGSKDFLCERRDLAVEFVYCLVLIEVLSKFTYHPGQDELVNHIIKQAFRHFKYRDGLQTNPNAANVNTIADLYSEVVGVLAQSRFQAVRKTFLNELKELKLRDQTPYTAQSIISLLMGLKFFRVKMHPIEDFEACVSFLQELGHYFIEVKDRDIRHALAGLFVEILLPVAATAKNEVNVPVLKNFVDMLYTLSIDMTTKRKHTLHLFPLVTCLLCVSHRQFFLNNWPYFLTMCLSQLKNKDNKMSRVALESLYRLLWVYMVRIKCESNTATQSRLQSIVNSLFPKGSKMVTPKETPLNIFVKIIQFIAKERLDFAMRDIIFDLLCVGRNFKFLTPERMSIGLRAFLVIADSLQQKDGDPPMPQSTGTLPSGSTVRVKRQFVNKMLSDSTAKAIGLSQFYPYILKTFDAMLRALDLQVGRPLLLTKAENANREADEMIVGDRKPKIDLFRTCIAAIPRLIPEGMSSQEVVEVLTRLTVHVDEELKGLAFQALQNLMLESPQWKEHVIHGFVQFVHKDISDTNIHLVDGSLRMLMQLLVQWKSNPVTVKESHGQKDKPSTEQQTSNNLANQVMSLGVLHEVEGLALVMMCSCRVVTRKLAVHLLKEVRNIFNSYPVAQICTPCLIDVIDKACPAILEKLQVFLPAQEKSVVLSLSNIDLAWVVDRAASCWVPANGGSTQDGNQINYSFHRIDVWIRFIAAFTSKDYALTACLHALVHAWPIVYTKLNALFPLVDPNTQTNDNRASSILRSGSKKVTTEKDVHMQLWQNYVVLACSIAQQGAVIPHRCSSPELGSSSPESVTGSEKSESRQNTGSSTATNLFRLLVPLMKCENSDMRDTVVNGLGYCNPMVFKELAEELLLYLKEAIDKKQDNLRRRRKRDVLRVQLAHIFELMAEHKTFAQSESGIIDKDHGCLSSMFVDYIDGARQYLEGENDRDLPILQEIRLHFSGFIQNLICNTPLELRRTLLSRELRYGLFHLFASWSGHFSHTFGALDRRLSKEEAWSEQELSAVRAMSAVLCCGPVFDSTGLGDDGYIYSWLDTLLSSHDEKIYSLAKETVFLLLDFNPDVQGLLDWVIDRCYTGANEVADGCFNALAAVFQTREYPCDHVAMLNLAVLNVGSPRIQTHETALQLLHLLDTRFFQEEPVFTDNSEESHQPQLPLNDILLSVTYCHSQMYLSEQLARIHPDLTMPMFSEITHRFQTAKPSVRQTLLKYLLPWLHNMELVDPAIPPSNPISNFLNRLADSQTEAFFSPLKGEGWGSTQATEMVLNNLFFITIKFGDEHPAELEALWSALVMCWVNNLKVVIRYLVVITNVAPMHLLSFVKRVVSYLGRAKPEKLVDELMSELQTVETLNMNIERTQTPPYYRLSSQRKVGGAPNTTDDEKLVCQTTGDCQLEKGVLHTKRHSTNEDLPSDTTPRTNSTASLKSIASSCSTAETLPQEEEVHAQGHTPTRSGEHGHSESPVPYPLPMPAYGGYFAQLNEFLPEDIQPTPGFHRSNIAVMFLSDLVLDGLEIDWSPHLPLMLHIIFLGLDHSRMLVYEHCKKLLQGLLLLASSQDHPDIARILVGYRSNPTETVKVTSDEREMPLTTETPTHMSSNTLLSLGKSTFSIDSSATITPDTMSNLTDPETLNTVEDVIRAILNFMESRKGKSLWSCEDITPKTLNTQSSSLLEYFLKCVVKAFKELSPLALVEQRWSQTALQLALSCSSRHYAGRSFQILRALRIRPSTQMLSDILSRLVETVAEQGDDMQGYVTEIMLTLEAAIDNLDLEFRPIDFMKELFMSTPNLAKDSDSTRRGAMTAPKQSLPHHARSTSYTASVVIQRAHAAANDSRNRASTDVDNRRTNLGRSRSHTSLKNLDQNGTEDKQSLVTQMFWIAVSLLESDYEYEFLLALRLLDKILCHLQPENPEWKEKLEKMQQQIKWPNFPGLQTLLLKGCTSAVTAEATWSLLSKIILCIKAPVIDPSGKWGFPMNTIALLPYLVANYEHPIQTCREAADHIAQMCTEQTERLSNLATVMSLYSRGTFGKDSFQWTKCVVKYLLDVSSFAAISMIMFLVEVLEKGPVGNQPAVLQILHCMTHYIDINAAPSGVLNSELFHTSTKYIQSSHWKEALKILKLAVTRSSTLAAAPPTLSTSLSSELSVYSHTSFAEADMYIKIHRDLPGRTLDFSVDLSKTPIIGRKYLTGGDQTGSAMASQAAAAAAASAQTSTSGVSLSRKPSNNQDIDSVWRRPQASQARTRERLVNLLTCFGPRVGLLKSPSVIFSQSSDTLDHQQSLASSGEETSLPEALSTNNMLDDSSGNELMVTFKGFDFLDNELEESENEDFFSQFGDRRHSLNLQDSPTTVRPHFGSVPDLKLIGSASLTEIQISPSESLSVKEEMPSEDEESESSVMEDNDGVPQDLPASESIIVTNPKLERRRRSSPLTASTRSLCSNPSEPDLVEMTSSVSSPSFSQLQTLSLNLQSDEVEEVWKGHVTRVMAEVSLSHTFSTFQIFPRLFRELRRRLMTMTKEACYYISKTESLKSVASQIHVLDLLCVQMECPFIFAEADSLIGSRVLERHRFCILEIQECFETYSMRKDQSEQGLEALKSSIKQQSLGDGGGAMLLCGEEQKVTLCRKLYKLVFQLVLLFESYLKLLEIFHSVTGSPQVTDMSLQVTSVKGALSHAMLELENGQASPFNVDSKAVNKQEAVASLAEYLHSHQHLKAIQLLRSFRSIWPNDVFGTSSEDDIVTLLNIYCSCLAEKKNGIFVLTRVDLDLNQLYGQLMDINVKLTNDWPHTVSASGSRTELTIRHQDSSTL